MLMCTYLHYCTIALFQIIITSVGVKIIKPCLEPGARAGAGLCMTLGPGWGLSPSRRGLAEHLSCPRSGAESRYQDHVRPAQCTGTTHTLNYFCGDKSRQLVTRQVTMFKSSFAQDLLQETRHQLHLQEEILPKELLSGGGQGYKSQFAASTHGPLDNVGLNMEAEATLERVRRPASKFGSNLDNMNESSGGDINQDLQTSDLGASDFSSSELWPPSNSSSPFEYAPRYRGGRGEVGSGSERSVLNSPGDGSRDNRLNAPSSSFLNLQSSMQFSYLKRVRRNIMQIILTALFVKQPYGITCN